MDLEEENKRLKSLIAKLQVEKSTAEKDRDSFKTKLGRTLAVRDVEKELAKLGVPAAALDTFASMALLEDELSFDEDGSVLRGGSIQSAKALAEAATKNLKTDLG